MSARFLSTSVSSTSGPKNRRRRRAISLIEVIACTAIVAVMIVPIASVIRASGHAISRSTQMDQEAKLRSSVRWIKDTIHTGNVIDVGSRHLTLVTASGLKSELRLDSGRLVFSDGDTKTVVLENVSRFACDPIMRHANPARMIGVEIRIEGKNPQTGAAYDFECVIARS